MAKKEEPKKEEGEDKKEEKDDKKDKKDKKKDDAKGEEKPEGEAKEGEAPAEGEEGAAPKKSKKKIIIVGILALVILIGGAAGAYFAGLFGKHESKADAAEAAKNGEKAVFYTLPEFLVNLNTGGKQVSYLKMTIVLEVAHQTDVPMIEATLPRLFDALNTYLRELRASDLAGSAGIQRLREELLVRANKVLWPVKVDDILFKEIVVQ